MIGDTSGVSSKREKNMSILIYFVLYYTKMNIYYVI